MAKRDFVAEGLSARGFIAPAWLLGAEAEAAVKSTGFEYTTRLRSFKDLVSGRLTVSQSLVWSVRAGWRRVLSLCWNALLARKLSTASLLRVGLHPTDWRHGSIRRQALGLIRAALAGRDVMTYEDWLARMRSRSTPPIRKPTFILISPQHPCGRLGFAPSGFSGQLFGSAPDLQAPARTRKRNT